MGYLRILILSLIPLLAGAAEEWRTFTGADGRTMQAKILRVTGDAVVVELRATGKQMPISFDLLSKEDVDFLRDYKPPEATAAPPAAGGDESTDGDVTANRVYPRTKAEIQDGIREIEKRAKPADIDKDVHEATQQLNIYRFLCGVPSEVEPDVTFSKNATLAALACKKKGGLSHTIGSFTDRCNLSSMGDVVASVSQYIEDSGANNRDMRGHREWCLSPPMGKVGFGSGGDSYSAMWCMDTSGKGKMRGIWTYPGRGLFPLKYMHGNAWSLYGIEKPKSAAEVKVEVFRLSKRPEKPFSANEDIDGQVVKVNHVSLGMGSINFEPEDPAKRGTYWVRVKGGGVSEGWLVELY